MATAGSVLWVVHLQPGGRIRLATSGPRGDGHQERVVVPLYTSLRSLPILGPVADGPVVVPVARWRWLTAWWPRYRWPGAGWAGQVCRHRGRLLLSAALVMLAACLAGLPWCPASY